MKRLLQLARENADAAEVYLVKRRVTPLHFENGKLQKINLKSALDVALRIIRNGKMGFSFGTSLEDPNTLVNQATRSAGHGACVDFQFPSDSSQESFGNYDSAVPDYSVDEMAKRCSEEIEWLKEQGVDAPIEAGIIAEADELTILNTSGVEVTYPASAVSQYYMLILEGSGVGPFVEDVYHTYRKVDRGKLQKLCDVYTLSQKKCTIPTQKMKVLLTEDSIGEVVMWRIESGVSGRSLVEHITPLENRVGEKICDERITITENPRLRNFVGSRPFDDEGVPTQEFPIIEKGVFRNFVFDLNTAKKLGTASTGNGYKTTFWGGDISTPVTAYLRQPVFETGDLTCDEMVSQMDEGIVLGLANGAHSGNIPAGFFSVNVGFGLYVKDGVIQGRAGDAMISGNIYDLLQNLHSVSKEVNWKGLPCLLFNDVSVAGESH
jgi:PmbA protein